MLLNKFKNVVYLFLTLFSVLDVYSQAAEDVRYVFKNTSVVNQLQYVDEEIYIAVIGRSHIVGGGANIFLDDLNTNSPEVVLMSTTLNTLPGPDGGSYGDIFGKLSELPINGDGDYYIDVPPIFGGQIWIGLGSPLFISLGNGTYAGPDIGNPVNPNFDIRFEIIEFTQTQEDRIISNTTRVDVYQYPMGQEMYGPNGEYMKVGETVSHEQVIAKWKLFVDEPFLAALDDNKGIIHQPSKIAEFQEGGAYDDYLGDLIDAIWTQYSTETLQANWGGVSYTANVVGGNLVWNTGESFGKPSTSDIIGGTGALENGIGQIFGVVINRGVLDLDNHGEQVWDDEANYYKINPKNDYTHFFHSDLVSFESQTYAFAYDDVFDHSSTSTQDNATKVVISIGGFGIEHTQVLTDIYIDPLTAEIDEFQTFQFEVKGLDQALFDMDLPTDAVITWSVVGDATLIDQNGLFGPADIGTYTVQVTVVANSVTYTAESTITVNEAGTTGQVCVGEIDDYTSYRIETINDKVFLTLVPTGLFDGTGQGLLFYDRAGPVDPSLSINTNQAVELVGVFIGSSVEFSYVYFLSVGQRQSAVVTIANLGTCDGLVIEEYVVQIAIDQQNQTLDIGDVLNLTVTGTTNESNSVSVTEDIVWSGEGVDANGVFTATIAGEYIITANVDGYSAQTTITVESSCPTTILDIGIDSSICDLTSFDLNFPDGTFTDLLWSGTGSIYLGTDLTIEEPTFTASGSGNFVLTVDGEDASGCPVSGTRTITVNALPTVSLSPLSVQCLGSDEGLITATVNPIGGTGVWIGATEVTETTANFDPSNLGDNEISYTYRSLEGCSLEEIQTLIVNSLPTVSLSTLGAQCLGGEEELITATVNPIGGTGVWVGATEVSETTANFNPSSLADNEIRYTYTSLEGCSKEEIETITVNESPNLAISYNTNEICDYEELLPVTLSHGLGIISVFPLSGELTVDGSFDPKLSGEGDYTISYNYTDALTGCEGDEVTFDISVNPRPVTDISANITELCDVSEAIDLQATLAGGSFSGTGIVSDQFDPSGLDLVSNPYKIGYNYTDPITNCEALQSTHEITIVHTDAPVAQSQSVFDYEVTSQATVPGICAVGTNINWYSTADITSVSESNTTCFSVPFVDLSPADGNMDVGIYSWYANQTVDNCPSEAVEVTLVVTNCSVPLPSTVKHNSCEGLLAIEVSAIGTGGDLGWWSSVPSNPVLGDEVATGNSWDGHGFTAVGIHNVYVAEYNATEGCYGPVAGLEIEVHANPVPEINEVGTICSTEPSVDIAYSPTSGVLSGGGIIGSIWTPQFDATQTSVTTTTLTLTATEEYGVLPEVTATCDAVTSRDVDVVYVSEVTGTGIDSKVIQSISDISSLPEMLIMYGESFGVTFSVKDVNGFEISNEGTNPLSMYPSLISAEGEYEYTVTQELLGCISDPVTSLWEITSCPVTTIDIGADTTMCDLSSFTLTLPEGTSYSNLLWSGTGSVFLGADLTIEAPVFTASGSGEFEVTLEGQDGSGCPVIGTRTITVNEVPNLSVSYNSSSVCHYGELQQATLSHGLGVMSVLPSSGGMYADGSFDPKLSVAGNYTIFYNYTDTQTGCVGEEATFDITVNPRPETDLSGNVSEVCDVSDAITLQASISGGVFSGLGIGSGQFDPSGLSLVSNPYQVAYNYTDPVTTCEALESIHNINIIHTDAPVAQSISVVADLVTDQGAVPEICAIGTDINWYNTSDISGVSLSNTTCFKIPFVDSSPVDGIMDLGTYTMYANQTIDNCPSEATEVTLVVTDCSVPLPSTVKHNSCEGDLAIEVSAEGTGGNLGWWSSIPSDPVLGDELAIGNSWDGHGFTTVGRHTVYVAEYNTADGCYGPISPLEIEIHANPVPEIESVGTICSTELSIEIRYNPSIGVLSGTGVVGNSWTPQFDDSQTGITTTTLVLTATEEYGTSTEVIANCSADASTDVGVVYVAEVTGTGIGTEITIALSEIESLPELMINYVENLGGTFSVLDVTGEEISDENSNPRAMYPDLILQEGIYEYTVTQELLGCISNPVKSLWSVVSCETKAPENQFITSIEGDNLPVIVLNDSGQNHIWTSEDQITVLATSNELDLAEFGEDYTAVGSYIFYVSKEELDGSGTICRGPQGQIIFEVLERDELEEILIPNGFSPNGDGKNETWSIEGLVDYDDVNVVVYNRWGGKVFESDGYDNPWDGMNKSGDALPNATYYYVISSSSDETVDFSGTVTILR